jgi:hypothetical protein
LRLEGLEPRVCLAAAPVGVDLAPDLPLLKVSDAAATEGAPLTFHVSLSVASDEAVSVRYQAGHGTATSADYQSSQGSLVFQPGELLKSIEVAALGDENAFSLPIIVAPRPL